MVNYTAHSLVCVWRGSGWRVWLHFQATHTTGHCHWPGASPSSPSTSLRFDERDERELPFGRLSVSVLLHGIQMPPSSQVGKGNGNASSLIARKARSSPGPIMG